MFTFNLQIKWIIFEYSRLVIMKIKRLKYILLFVAIVLLIPLIAMQLTDEVNWNLTDFFVAAMLLISTGLIFDFILRKIKSTNSRIIISILLFLCLILIWIELAVGLF